MKLALRIFGAVNIIASLLSFYYSAGMTVIHWDRWPGNPNHWEWAVFFAIKAVSVTLVACVAYLGVRLVLYDFKALRKVALIFVLEIVFWLVHFYVTWIAMPISKGPISVGLWGIAIDEVDTQVLSGYALLGMAIAATLILIERRRSKNLQALVG